MPKTEILTVTEQKMLCNGIFELRLSGDIGSPVPGQFVNIMIDGFYLRRPISVCDVKNDELTLIYRAVGDGTRRLGKATKGDKFDVLLPLGNGFTLDGDFSSPLLFGGGVGAPPMYYTAKKLVENGLDVTVVLGFSDKGGAFYIDRFKELSNKVYVSTVDGSLGTKGFVTDVLRENDIKYDYVFACGPEPMLKAVYDISNGRGQLSFEERMACGFGACMGCSCKTKYGNKRICTDGPVLDVNEVIW